MKKNWNVALGMSIGVLTGALAINYFFCAANAALGSFGTWEGALFMLIAIWYTCIIANDEDVGLRNAVILCPFGLALGAFTFQLCKTTPNWWYALGESIVFALGALGYGACRYLVLQPKKT